MFFKAAIILSIICLTNALSCTKLLHELADEQSKLIYCITANSVPVTMCMSCADRYSDLLQTYDTLVTNCSSLYFNKDRINIVASTQNMLTGLWSKAFCDDCFNNNNSFVFDDKNSTFQSCRLNAKDNPCDKCRLEYMDLNNFYINLDQHNNGEVCYDLQDSMNRSRNTWSKDLKCCRREYNMTFFAVALSVVSCLPVLFYGTTYLLTKRLERNHSVLNDEDPTYNSELPSSSHGHNINNINNSVQPMITNGPSSSNADINVTAIRNLQPTNNNISYLKEDLESSDDDIEINTAVNSEDKLLNFFK